MAQASVVRPSVRPITQVSQKPLHGSRPNVVESYLPAISPDGFFSFFKVFDIQIFNFFSFPLTWDPMHATGAKFQNATPPTFSI